MKPGFFAYERPETVAEVLTLLDKFGEDAKILSGGQSLVPLLSMRLARPEVLIDINDVPLAEVNGHGRVLRIGALVRHRQLEHDLVIATKAPLLTAAAGLIGHPPIRVRGTLGGSVVHADPAAELPAVMVALDAIFHLESRLGSREVAADDFFEGPFMTGLSDSELLTGVDVPVHDDHRCVYEEFAIRAGDFAVVGVAAAVSLDEEGTVASARLALSGAAARPVRARAAEEILTDARLDAGTIDAAATAAASEARPTSDIHGSEAYRRHLVGVLVRRALRRIVDGQKPAGRQINA